MFSQENWGWLETLGWISVWPWTSLRTCRLGFIRQLLKLQPQKQRGTAAGVPALSAESWCFDSVTQSSILCTWWVAALRCQSLSWHVLLKLSTRKQVWSSISPVFPKVSRCFRKWVWSLILWHVPAFIFGLQVSKAHGVQSFSGFLSPHKEVCHLQMNEYSPNMCEITSNVKSNRLPRVKWLSRPSSACSSSNLLQEHSAKKTSTTTMLLWCLKEVLDVQKAEKKAFRLEVYGVPLLRISQALKSAKEPCAAMRKRHLKCFETWSKVFQPPEPHLVAWAKVVTPLNPEAAAASDFTALIFPRCSMVIG